MTRTAANLSSGDPSWAQVYQWAYRLLQNHHDALDATQEVMLREMRRSPGTISNRGAWLRRVTVNLCVDAIRRRRKAVLDNPDTDVEPAPESAAQQAELHEAVLAGLRILSSQQRTVLVAKLYDGETFSAIAETMGIAVSTVKTHYVRALEALREPLRQYGEE